MSTRLMQSKVRLLRTREIAKRMSVHPRTVERWINSGKLRASRIGKHGDWHITEDDFEAALGMGLSRRRAKAAADD